MYPDISQITIEEETKLHESPYSIIIQSSRKYAQFFWSQKCKNSLTIPTFVMWTLAVVPLRSVLTRFDCIYLISHSGNMGLVD